MSGRRVSVPIFPTPLSGESAHYELGLHYVAEMVKSRWDWQWKLLDADNAGGDADVVLERDPDIVFLPVHRTKIPRGFRLVNDLGRLRPDVPVVWCGWSAHPPFLDAALECSELRVTHPSFALACGEVEAVLPAILDRMEAGAASVSQLVGLGGVAMPGGQASGAWTGSQAYQFVPDLTTLPDLPRSWIETIPKFGKAESQACWIDVSRGCPYKCAFCVASAFERARLRSHPPEKIRGAIKQGVSAGMKVLGLLTASLTYNFDTLRTIIGTIEEIGDADVAIASPVDARFATGQKLEMLGRLKWANMTVGLQTTNRAAQRTLGRHDDPKKFARAIERISQFTTPEVEMILGLPGDSVEGFKQSVLFATSLPANVSVMRLRLDPWTRILMDRKRLGIAADFTRLGRVVSTADFTASDFDECEAFLREVGADLRNRGARALALDGQQLR